MATHPPNKIDVDEITKLVISDPENVPGTRMVAGWVGKGSKGRHWRLYQDPTFTSYLEINEDDIILSKKIDECIAPLGGSIIWVKSEAKLPHTRLTPSQAQTGFLSGQISRDHMGRVASSFTIGGDGGTAIHPTIIITILTITIANTIIVIVSTATDNACPNPNNSQGLCPTNLSACC